MGSNRFRVDMPRYIDLYLQGRLKLDELVSATYAVDDVQAALDDMHHGKLNLISVELHLPHRHDHGPGNERHVHLKPSS